MSHFDFFGSLVSTFAQTWAMVFGAPPPPPPQAPQNISQFFGNLYTDLTVCALGISVFFFAWAAIIYMGSGTSNERNKQHAQSSLYAALIGLALALLAQIIANMVKTAVPAGS